MMYKTQNCFFFLLIFELFTQSTLVKMRGNGGLFFRLFNYHMSGYIGYWVAPQGKGMGKATRPPNYNKTEQLCTVLPIKDEK